MSESNVFLIERGQPEGIPHAEWFATYFLCWVTSAHFATRYPDQPTAERAILFLGLQGHARAIGHTFYDDEATCICTCYPNMCPLGCEPACPRCS